MYPEQRNYRFEFEKSTVLYGRGTVAELSSELSKRGLSRSLLVCGSNVGSNRDLMGPLRDALGGQLVNTFAQTSPSKYIGTAFAGAERMVDNRLDSIISVGGGSSIAIGKAISFLAVDSRSEAELRNEIQSNRIVSLPDSGFAPIPHFIIPTTLAGADLSEASGINTTRESPRSPPTSENVQTGILSHPELLPDTIVFDPEMFETTPVPILRSSAMNGFDKGLETIYSPRGSAISDATSRSGLQNFRSSLPSLSEPDPPSEAIDQLVEGSLLVQYRRQTNIIHAFGHGFSFYYPVQQGVVHSIIAPHVLNYVFDTVDGRRRFIASTLGLDHEEMSDSECASGIVDLVKEIRDDLRLPTALRTIKGLKRSHLSDIASIILTDHCLNRAPSGLDTTEVDILEILTEAW